MGLVPKKGGDIRVHEKAKMGGGKDGAAEKSHSQKAPNHGGRNGQRGAERGGDIKVHGKADMEGAPDQAAGQASGDIHMADPRAVQSGEPAGGLMQNQQAEVDPKEDPRFTNADDSGVTPEEQASYDKFMDNALKLIYKPDGSTVLDGILAALSKGGDQPAQPATPPAADPNAAPAPEPGAPGAMPAGGLMAPAADVAAQAQPETNPLNPTGPAPAAPPEGAPPAGLMADQTAPDEGQSIGTPPPQIIALANLTVTIVSKLDDSATQAGKPVPDSVLLHGGADVMSELAEVAEAAGIHDYTEEEMEGAMTTALDMYRQKAITEGRTDENTLKTQWADIMRADQEGRLNEAVPGLASKKQEA